jgi:hypothetical protein
MCQVGRAEWGMNMVGTVQSSRVGGGKLRKAAVNRTPAIRVFVGIFY